MDWLYQGVDKNVFTQSYGSIIASLLAMERAVFFVIAFAAWRAWRVLFHNSRRFIDTDAVLFGGAAYAVAFIAIKGAQLYYYTPAIACAVPSAYLWFDRWLRAGKVARMVAAGGLILLQVPLLAAGLPYLHDRKAEERRALEFVLAKHDGESIKLRRLGKPANNMQWMARSISKYMAHMEDAGAGRVILSELAGARQAAEGDIILVPSTPYRFLYHGAREIECARYAGSFFYHYVDVYEKGRCETGP